MTWFPMAQLITGLIFDALSQPHNPPASGSSYEIAYQFFHQLNFKSYQKYYFGPLSARVNQKEPLRRYADRKSNSERFLKKFPLTNKRGKIQFSTSAFLSVRKKGPKSHYNRILRR